MEVKYPHITVQLSGEDGNPFFILGKMKRALTRDADAGEAAWLKFRDEATSGDYDHLLQTCMKWVDVL
jgi:hypothetical protein